MTTKEKIEAAMGNPSYELTDAEFDAVTDWIQAEMDGLPFTVKEGLLKLINAETHRRL